jgi:N-acetylmuramoyl-L-alanine amidase
MSLGKSTRWLRGIGCAVGMSCLAAVCSAAVDTATPARSHGARKAAALSPWEQAERGRDALEAMPEGDRTRADYTRAMNGYRAIYHANPADAHSPAAVNAVAELLAEQGRTLHDAKSSQAAVGQYEFLRKQYPGSSLGVQALLAEGQIEQDDLGDANAAREKYKLLLKEHPKSEQAEEAQAGLESLKQVRGSSSGGRGSVAKGEAAKTQVTDAGTGTGSGTPSSVAEPAHRDRTAMNGARMCSGIRGRW